MACAWRLVLGSSALGRAESQPGDLGQQVGAVAGDLPQFRCPVRLFGFGRGVAPCAPPGDTGQPGYEQAVRVGSRAITCHLVRIEHADYKSKLATLTLTDSTPAE